MGCSYLEKVQEGSGERRVFHVRKAWVKQTTASDNLSYRKINRAKPLWVGDLIVAANPIDGVVAYNKNTGHIAWRVNVPNGVETTGVAINDRLFFGANDGSFYSVNAKNGQILWTFPTRIENLSEPLLVEGIVYFLTGNNSLYALDAVSGKQLWMYSRSDTSSFSIRGGSKPAFRNGTIYVGFSDGHVVALMAKTGAVKWEKQLNKNKKFRDLDSSPLIEGDYLYISGFDEGTYCLRAATGDQVWRSEYGGYGNILLVNDKLYFAGTNNEVVALDKVTGQKYWTYKLKDGIATSPTLYKGLIVVGESQGALLFIDANTGKIISFFEPGRGIFSQSLADEKNSLVYFMSNESVLYSLEAKWDYPKHIPYLN